MPTRPHRMWLYPLVLALIYIGWAFGMTTLGRWGNFASYWPLSITMAFGSFVAGSTAAGGGAVAYPVFTKLFAIPSEDARTFALMIQTFGMGMASFVIWLRRDPILPRVILWSCTGSILGLVLGTYLIAIPSPYPKVLFTSATALFGITLALTRWGLGGRTWKTMPLWGDMERLTFVAVGLIGGVVASVVGTGTDMLVFMVLTLAFGLDEKVGTLTSVPIMAITSAAGFALHTLVVRDVGIVWEYWSVCVPIVIVGAPIGALVLSRLQRDHVIGFLLVLIAFETITTLWLVPLTDAIARNTLIFTAVCVCSFAALVAARRYRRI